ncbi:hypothetical protein [Ruegeria sp.]|uniref:hypothetical protein n=1 Tax=Ruegeria sp. TaxID=1879320 RepID=UPI003B59C899
MSEIFKKDFLSYTKAIGSIGGFLAVVFVVVQISKGQTWVDSNSKLLLTHGAYWFLLLLVGWLIVSWQPEDYLASPKVRVVRDDGILIVEKSPWLGIGVGTAIYLIEDDFEKLICGAEVINIQSNELVQLKTAAIDSDHPDYLAALKASKDDILVKPGLYR